MRNSYFSFWVTENWSQYPYRFAVLWLLWVKWLHTNIRIVTFEANEGGKTMSGKCWERWGSSGPYVSFRDTRFAFHVCKGCFVQAHLYLGKRMREDLLKETKEAVSLCTAIKMQREAVQVHLSKNPDNPIDRSGIISGVSSARCYFQNYHHCYHHRSPRRALRASRLKLQMFPSAIKANMWPKLLAAFLLMDQDGLRKVFSMCFPFAPSAIHREG